MSDYIKREDAINIKDYLKRFGCFGDCGFVEIEGVLIALSKIPSADVAPVRHGHWFQDAIYYGEDGSPCIVDICTECGSYGDYVDFKYCPNCGAKMDYDEWLASNDI